MWLMTENAVNMYDPSGLLLSGRTYGASICTATAANASVSIDNKLVSTLGDAAGGASISASAARNALVRNLVCHYRYLHIRFV